MTEERGSGEGAAECRSPLPIPASAFSPSLLRPGSDPPRRSDSNQPSPSLTLRPSQREGDVGSAKEGDVLKGKFNYPIQTSYHQAHSKAQLQTSRFLSPKHLSHNTCRLKSIATREKSAGRSMIRFSLSFRHATFAVALTPDPRI